MYITAGLSSACILNFLEILRLLRYHIIRWFTLTAVMKLFQISRHRCRVIKFHARTKSVLATELWRKRCAAIILDILGVAKLLILRRWLTEALIGQAMIHLIFGLIFFKIYWNLELGKKITKLLLYYISYSSNCMYRNFCVKMRYAL